MGAILPDGDEAAIPTRDVVTVAWLLDEAGDATPRSGRRRTSRKPGFWFHGLVPAPRCSAN
jgi:hypothetical protein